METTERQPKILGRGVKKLPCVLTDAELLDFGQQIAAKKQELDNHVEQTKATAKTMAARKAELEARVNEIALALRTKKEMRDVGYREEADFATGLAVTIRDDTNATLHTRPLTPDERQERLFGEGATEKTIPDRPEEVWAVGMRCWVDGQPGEVRWLGTIQREGREVERARVYFAAAEAGKEGYETHFDLAEVHRTPPAPPALTGEKVIGFKGKGKKKGGGEPPPEPGAA